MPRRRSGGSGHEDAHRQVAERGHVKVHRVAQDGRTGRDGDAPLSSYFFCAPAALCRSGALTTRRGTPPRGALLAPITYNRREKSFWAGCIMPASGSSIPSLRSVEITRLLRAWSGGDQTAFER